MKGRSLFSRRLTLLLGTLALTPFCARDGKPGKFVLDQGGIVRGDVSEKKIALVFTGHEFADGGGLISDVLKRKKARASFFFTGDFYREEANAALIKSLREDGHYLGPHSDRHLLYCSWENREQLLVTKEEFSDDILRNYQAMEAFSVSKEGTPFFIPPYEWYNKDIVNWAKDLGLILCNFTAGTLSNADYTTPDMSNYQSSSRIYQSIFDREKTDPHGLNGFILLVHIGTHPDREDKFYRRLEELLSGLQARGYRFVGIDDLLGAG
ncbi:MAG: polysaccharide deacetylase family protein [Candidatus Aminicenantales bacterium]